VRALYTRLAARTVEQRYTPDERVILRVHL
jgi:hypothetical protein